MTSSPPGTTLFPLCINQERMLFYQERLQFYRQDALRRSVVLPYWNMMFGLRLTGELDFDALKRALDAIVSRHPGLRVAIFDEPGVSPEDRAKRFSRAARSGALTETLYAQTIVDGVRPEVGRIDISTFDAASKDGRIRRILENESRRPFNKLEPPLLRAVLIQLEKNEYLLVIVVDHCVIDAWSARIIQTEFRLFYAHFCGANGAIPMRPAMSYPEFAEWQARMARSNYFDRSIEYWKGEWERFGGARIGIDDLRCALHPSHARDWTFSSESTVLDSDDSEDIRHLARSLRLTLHSLFLAVFAILIHGQSGKTVVPLRIHLLNRTRPETRGLVGHLINMHLIGLDLTANPNGREFLNQARMSVVRATAHQELPIELLWRTLGQQPRVPDAMFRVAFRNTDDPEPETGRVGGLNITSALLPPVSNPRPSSLSLHVENSRERINLRIGYSTGRFPQSAVRAMLEDLRSIIMGLLRDQDAPVFTLGQAPRLWAGS